MRREFIQVLAVVAIALGAGLFAFGRHLDPPVNMANPATAAISMHGSSEERAIASVAGGLGVALMTFGALSLAIPWVNMAIVKHHERPPQVTRSDI